MPSPVHAQTPGAGGAGAARTRGGDGLEPVQVAPRCTIAAVPFVAPVRADRPARPGLTEQAGRWRGGGGADGRGGAGLELVRAAPRCPTASAPSVELVRADRPDRGARNSARRRRVADVDWSCRPAPPRPSPPRRRCRAIGTVGSCWAGQGRRGPCCPLLCAGAPVPVHPRAGLPLPSRA